MKRICTLFLAFAMLAILAVTAYAEESDDYVYRSHDAESGLILAQAEQSDHPVNISEYDYMFIRFNLVGADKIIGASNGDGQIEISSGANCDVEEISWLIGNVKIVEGWNEIKLDLYNSDNSDGTFNSANCNWFRIYMFSDGYMKIDLDYVGFGMEDDVFGADTLPCYLVKSASQEVAEEVVEETTEEVVEETVVEEVVETPAVEEAPVAAPQTFDFGVIAAIASIVSAVGYTISKKR